jgi:hypothetical protein
VTEFILARILYLALALLASDDGDGSIFLRVALIARASTCVNTNAMQPHTKVACSQRSEFSDFSLLVLPVIYAHSYTSSALGTSPNIHHRLMIHCQSKV